jgi:hypothetical protein
MLVAQPHGGSLPPPPPGMVYLVSIPQNENPQQSLAAAHQQHPDEAQKMAYDGNEVPLEEAPEVNPRSD